MVTGLVERNARVLSRPYLRAFPGTATFRSDPATGRAHPRRGVAAPRSGPVEAWVPGAARPVVHTTSLRILDLPAVPGGWLLSATPTTGPWTMAIHP